MPADIVGPALFRASSATGFITGAVLPVDGAYTAVWRPHGPLGAREPRPPPTACGPVSVRFSPDEPEEYAVHTQVR
jgi:hypothetical protein